MMATKSHENASVESPYPEVLHDTMTATGKQRDDIQPPPFIIRRDLELAGQNNGRPARYNFQPLPPGRFIRLLQIRSISAGGRETLQLELVPFSLDACPFYKTMSYVWGDTNRDDYSLRLGELELGITYNLSVALPHVLGHCFEGYLWCDQLCINQDDIGERNAQVPLMADIYRRASGVLIWFALEGDVAETLYYWLHALGLQHKGYAWSDLHMSIKDHENEDQADIARTLEKLLQDATGRSHSSDAESMDFDDFGNHIIDTIDSEAGSSMDRDIVANDCSREDEEMADSGASHDIDPFSDSDSGEYADQNTTVNPTIDSDVSSTASAAPSPEMELKSALESFLDNAWFSRVWIVQEALLSPTVSVLLGDHICSFQGLAYLVTAFFDRADHKHIEVTDIGGGIILYLLCDWHLSSSFTRSLYGLLGNLCTAAGDTLEATDPRDVIYGLLALTNNEDPFVIEPNYFLPWDLVFIVTARSLVESRHDLSILLLCDERYGTSSAESRSPSWVPNWGRLIWFRSIRELDIPAPGSREQTPMTDVRQLHTRGKFLDQISDIARPDLFDAIRDWFLSVLLMSEPLAPLRKDLVDHDRCLAELRSVRDILEDDIANPRIDEATIIKTWFSWSCTKWFILPEEGVHDLAPQIIANFNSLAAPYRSANLEVPGLDAPVQPIPSPYRGPIVVKCEHDSRLEYCEVEDCSTAVERLLLRASETFSETRTIICSTTEGKVVLPRRNIRTGDVIAVLHGFHLPVVLRETPEGYYQFVCECYLEDAMCGDDLIEWPEDEAEDIVLV